MEIKEVNLGKRDIYSCIRKVARGVDKDLQKAGRPRTPQLQALFEWLEKKERKASQ